MTTFKLVTIENKFLETKTFIIEIKELIDGKIYTENLYEYKDENQAKSKIKLLETIYN